MRSVKPAAPKSKSDVARTSGAKEVDDFISTLNHPLKKVVEMLRKIILSTNKEITEHIKWKAPSFVYDGDDKITFNLSKDNMVMIIFHRGAKVKDSNGKETLFKDTTGLLEWLSSDRAVAKFSSLAELTAKTGLFKKIVTQWLKSAN